MLALFSQLRLFRIIVLCPSLLLYVCIVSAAYVSRPDLVASPWNVSYTSTNSSTPLADGYIFIAPRVVEPTSIAIYDNDGEPVYINNDTWARSSFDFRPVPYNNDSWLALWSGTAEVAGYGKGYALLMDHAYEIQYNFTATNLSDFHEFHVNADNSVVTTLYNADGGIDTTGFSYGIQDSYVLDGCFVESDIESGAATFEWCALENGVTLWDGYNEPAITPNSSDNAWDFFHINAVSKDALGNYLVSSRHAHTVYYIDGSSSEILWRLGGKNSTFTGSGTNFSWQHDVRWVDETNTTASDISAANAAKRYLTIYNNAASNWEADGTESQGLYIELDFSINVSTIITAFHSPGGETDLLSQSQGNVQFLDSLDLGSDNVFMGYGSISAFAEYARDGNPIRLVHYGEDQATAQDYRIFKNSWIGTPVTAPDVAIQDGILYVSWNGATEVTMWNIIQGDSVDAMSNTTTVNKSGFETAVDIDATKAATQVVAVDSSGNLLAKSNVLASNGTSLGGAINGTKYSTNSTTTSQSADNHGVAVTINIWMYSLATILAASFAL